MNRRELEVIGSDEEKEFESDDDSDEYPRKGAGGRRDSNQRDMRTAGSKRSKAMALLAHTASQKKSHRLGFNHEMQQTQRKKEFKEIYQVFKDNHNSQEVQHKSSHRHSNHNNGIDIIEPGTGQQPQQQRYQQRPRRSARNYSSLHGLRSQSQSHSRSNKLSTQAMITPSHSQLQQFKQQRRSRLANDRQNSSKCQMTPSSTILRDLKSRRPPPTATRATPVFDTPSQMTMKHKLVIDYGTETPMHSTHSKTTDYHNNNNNGRRNSTRTKLSLGTPAAMNSHNNKHTRHIKHKSRASAIQAIIASHSKQPTQQQQQQQRNQNSIKKASSEQSYLRNNNNNNNVDNNNSPLSSKNKNRRRKAMSMDLSPSKLLSHSLQALSIRHKKNNNNQPKRTLKTLQSWKDIEFNVSDDDESDEEDNNNYGNNNKRRTQAPSVSMKHRFALSLKQSSKLLLPITFGALIKKFQAMETTMAMYMRKNQFFVEFVDIQSSIQMILKKNFSMTDLQQILFVMPAFYSLKWSANKKKHKKSVIMANQSNNNANALTLKITAMNFEVNDEAVEESEDHRQNRNLQQLLFGFRAMSATTKKRSNNHNHNNISKRRNSHRSRGLQSKSVDSENEDDSKSTSDAEDDGSASRKYLSTYAFVDFHGDIDDSDNGKHNKGDDNECAATLKKKKNNHAVQKLEIGKKFLKISVQKERLKVFKYRLAQYMVEHHSRFLKGHGLLHTNPLQTGCWHPRFDIEIEAITSIPVFPLPLKPAKAAVNKVQSMINVQTANMEDFVEKELLKLKKKQQQQKQKTSSTAADDDVFNPQKNTAEESVSATATDLDSSLNHSYCIPEHMKHLSPTIIAHARAKRKLLNIESSACLNFSTKSKNASKSISNKNASDYNSNMTWSRIPYLCNLLRSTFAILKKRSMPYKKLVTLLRTKHKNELISEDEIIAQMNLLSTLECKFIIIKKSFSMVIVKCNYKSVDMNLVMQQIQRQLDGHGNGNSNDNNNKKLMAGGSLLKKTHGGGSHGVMHRRNPVQHKRRAY